MKNGRYKISKVILLSCCTLLFNNLLFSEITPEINTVSNLEKGITEKKQINVIVNLFGQEVNQYYRGCVVVHYADGSTLKKVQ